ncbi:hypothetical protein CMK13_00130 [Candidatus Poribacteria bacterium]|nr:hypothetical protein [Candidatus Poribacteria bacterium]OUT68573.1 MAG: hypothetical protein CBB75_00010 [bacterium TMED15]
MVAGIFFISIEWSNQPLGLVESGFGSKSSFSLTIYWVMLVLRVGQTSDNGFYRTLLIILADSNHNP